LFFPISLIYDLTIYHLLFICNLAIRGAKSRAVQAERNGGSWLSGIPEAQTVLGEAKGSALHHEGFVPWSVADICYVSALPGQ
jgi:hypothetical protein